ARRHLPADESRPLPRGRRLSSYTDPVTPHGGRGPTRVRGGGRGHVAAKRRATRPDMGLPLPNPTAPLSTRVPGGRLIEHEFDEFSKSHPQESVKEFVAAKDRTRPMA